MKPLTFERVYGPHLARHQASRSRATSIVTGETPNASSPSSRELPAELQDDRTLGYRERVARSIKRRIFRESPVQEPARLQTRTRPTLLPAGTPLTNCDARTPSSPDVEKQSLSL